MIQLILNQFDWKYIPFIWSTPVDYDIIEVTQEQFEKLQSWYADIVDWKYIDNKTPKQISDIEKQKIAEEKLAIKYSIENQIAILTKVLCELSEDIELHKLADFIQNK